MLVIFQVLFVLFAIFAVFGVVKKKQQGLLGPKGAFFWVLFWVAVAIVVAWPNSTATIATLFGIGRGVDVVIYVAIVALFYLLFKLHIKVESIGRDVTKVVRKEALDAHSSQDTRS